MQIVHIRIYNASVAYLDIFRKQLSVIPYCD